MKVYGNLGLFRVWEYCKSSQNWLIYVVSYRIQELKDLGELSPHWDNLRKDVISRYDQIIKEYQDTLVELEKLTGKGFLCSEACPLTQIAKHIIFCLCHFACMRIFSNANSFCNSHAITQNWSAVPSCRSMNFFFLSSRIHANFLVHQIFIRSSQFAVIFNAMLNSHGCTCCKGTSRHRVCAFITAFYCIRMYKACLQ